MDSQFDKDGKYFAQLTEDGKLKIWNTLSNSFEQEYVPDLHLTSPCICLQFIESWHVYKNGSPKKKKKRNSLTDSIPEIILGTAAGHLVLYSISKGDVNCTIKGDNNLSVNCLSPNIEEVIYVGAEEYIISWNIQLKQMIEKWKSGNDKISAILAIAGTKKLLTASRSIKLWNVETKDLLKTFKGHSSEVNFLKPIPSIDSSEPKYVISGSKADRLLNCWNLNEDVKDGHTTASLLLEDVVRSISSTVSSDGTTKLSASVGRGIVHIFQFVLNGKCTKPLKSKTTVQVVSDTGQKKDVIMAIPIISTLFKSEETLLIAHGHNAILTFEDVELTSKKVICLLRENKQLNKSIQKQTSKVLTPVSNEAHYVTPLNNATTTSKRKAGEKLEVPMEQRLENLTLNKLEKGSIPKSDNMAQLLLQGLRSKDQNIIKTVLYRRDEQAIKNTIKRLPFKVISQLVKELTTVIQGKTLASQIGALWMRHLIQTHAALLISNPELPSLLAPILSNIEYRLTLQSPLSRLKGRLDLLVSQISASSNEDSNENDEALLVFDDKEPSDSDQEIEMADLLNSASEEEWSEEESSDEEMAENEKSMSDEDVEMSS